MIEQCHRVTLPKRETKLVVFAIGQCREQRRLGGIRLAGAEPRLTPRALRRYRNSESPEPGWDSERAYWESRSPIIRFGRYLQAQGWYDGQQEEELRKRFKEIDIDKSGAIGKQEFKTLVSWIATEDGTEAQ